MPKHRPANAGETFASRIVIGNFFGACHQTLGHSKDIAAQNSTAWTLSTCPVQRNTEFQRQLASRRRRHRSPEPVRR